MLTATSWRKEEQDPATGTGISLQILDTPDPGPAGTSVAPGCLGKARTDFLPIGRISCGGATPSEEQARACQLGGSWSGTVESQDG